MDRDGAVMSAELDGVVDLVAEVGERADSLSADQAIAALEAVQDIVTACRATLSLLEDQLKVTLEQPRRVGDKTYEIVDDWKWRPDQAVIKSNIVSAAVVRAEDAERAATRAVELTYQLFVAPGSMPKVTGLRSLGLGKDDVAECELHGRKLIVRDHSQPGGAR